MWPLTENAADTIDEGPTEGCFASLSAGGDVLEYSSYLGGQDVDQINDVVIDELGHLYIAGTVDGMFPCVTANALFPDTGLYGENGFIVQFGIESSLITYGSYIPGGSRDIQLMPVSPNRLWVSGLALMPSLPVTDGSFQQHLGNVFDGTTGDGFFMAWDFDANVLLYSSYLGAEGNDACGTLAYSSESGLLFISGVTSSINFPVSTDAYDTVIVDSVSMYDAFIAVIDTGANDIRATYVGGSGFESAHQGLYADSFAVTLVGSTFSTDFPTTPDAIDSILNDDGQMTIFIPDYVVCRLNRGVMSLVHSAYVVGRQ